MIEIELLAFFAAFIILWSLCALVDAKFNLNIQGWINGEIASPFKKAEKTKDFHSKNLQSRIENLEKIVTDRQFELNEKIRKL